MPRFPGLEFGDGRQSPGDGDANEPAGGAGDLPGGATQGTEVLDVEDPGFYSIGRHHDGMDGGGYRRCGVIETNHVGDYS